MEAANEKMYNGKTFEEKLASILWHTVHRQLILQVPLK